MPLVFGIAARAPSSALTRAFAGVVASLAESTGLSIQPAFTASYEELVAKFADGSVTLAWLPPLPFMALERAGIAVPLAAHHRAGAARFESVLLAREGVVVDAPADLVGKRIGWVDPLSTSGYVLPRIQLAARGVDPRSAFTERFFGSHDAVVRAVVAGVCDLAATWAHVEPTGRVVEGSWTEIAGAADVVRVAMSFGAVPADVTAARRALHASARVEITKVLLALGSDEEGAALLRAAFGARELRPWQDASYEDLRSAIADANRRGLLGAIDTLDLTRI